MSCFTLLGSCRHPEDIWRTAAGDSGGRIDLILLFSLQRKTACSKHSSCHLLRPSVCHNPITFEGTKHCNWYSYYYMSPTMSDNLFCEYEVKMSQHDSIHPPSQSHHKQGKNGKYKYKTWICIAKCLGYIITRSLPYQTGWHTGLSVWIRNVQLQHIVKTLIDTYI